MNRNISMSSKRLASSMALVLLAVGVFGSQQALAQLVATTKHNLGSSAAGTVNMRFSGTGETCVFCHTPHGASTTAAVPLWNRALPAGPYTLYNNLGTSSLTGATVPVGSVSIGCLSCHDGTLAINALSNAPGSGASNAAYTGGTWSGTAGTVNTTTGLMLGFSMLGQDLRNDHPIGIQYGGGMPAGGAYTLGTIADGTLKDPDFKGLLYADLNGQPVWWVETGANTTRHKSDMQLYTRTGATSVLPSGAAGPVLTGAQPFVECSSCHDAHNNVNTMFMRMANTGSALCLACHIK